MIARIARRSLAVASLLAVACQDGTAPSPPRLTVAGGDGQHAFVRGELSEIIIVELRDAAQHPIVGVRVTWAVAVGVADVITPEAPITDAEGRARARWKLDGTPGKHSLVATAADGASTNVTAWADAVPLPDVHALALITYEGSGQLVHPDVVRLPPSWSGDPFRLVATPYPDSHAKFENPSLYTGSTATIWNVPEAVQNPLERPGAGYLSDPDMVYDSDAGELRIYYRQVTSENTIWLIRSGDGIHWSVPMVSVHAANHLIVSPSIVRRGRHEWLMWSVNSGTVGCRSLSTSVELRRSADGVSWSTPEHVILSDPDGFTWHIDVEWLPSRNEYWAVYPVKKPGDCNTDRLRFATSADGLQWQSYPSPVLMKGANEDLKDVIYRSSFEYDSTSGGVSIWYSGARLVHGVYAWHLASEQLSAKSLFARVSAPPTAAAARSSVRATQNAPQLTDETAP